MLWVFLSEIFALQQNLSKTGSRARSWATLRKASGPNGNGLSLGAKYLFGAARRMELLNDQGPKGGTPFKC